MALLPRLRSTSQPVRLIASRLFSTPSLKRHRSLSRSFLSRLFLDDPRRSHRTPRAVTYPQKGYDQTKVREWLATLLSKWTVRIRSVFTVYDQTKVYIVIVVGLDHNNPKHFKASCIHMLASLLGSEEAALQSFIKSYTHCYPGFSATLTEPQAKRLAEFPGIIHVAHDHDIEAQKWFWFAPKLEGLVSDGVDAIGDEHSPCRRVWPEVVGMNAEAAKKKIKEDVPMVEVRVIPFRSIICDGYNPRRVRLFMDSSSKVMRPPKIG